MTIPKHFVIAPAALALLGVMWFVARETPDISTPTAVSSPAPSVSISSPGPLAMTAPEVPEESSTEPIEALLPKTAPTQPTAPIRAKIDGTQPGNSMIFGNLQISLIETVETGNPDETEYLAEISEAPKVTEEVSETSAEQFRAKWGWNAYNQLQGIASAEMQNPPKRDGSL